MSIRNGIKIAKENKTSRNIVDYFGTLTS